MTKEIEFILPSGDQVDLEIEVRNIMIQRAIDNPDYVNKNPWGEFLVLQGDILHGIQWSYVGDAEYDEDGEPDFEIDCSWHEE